jgi:hypothetical protein
MGYDGYQESGECMFSGLYIRYLTAAILIGATLFCGVVTAGTLSYAIGDKVDLSGTAYATSTMYLFVTGPGLDPNGVNPAQMKSPVVSGDPSTFVQVDVENDHWSYIWNTAHQGFSLKGGTYTMYAVSQPVAKNALPAVYGSIEISLSEGGISFPTSGTVMITTSPTGAAVYIDSQFIGNAPKSFTAAVGNHTLRIESPGYKTLVDSFTVTGNGIVTIEKTLVPVPALITTAGIPSGTPIPMTSLSPVPYATTTTPAVSLTTGVGIIAVTGAALVVRNTRER